MHRLATTACHVVAIGCAVALLAYALALTKPYPLWETWYFVPAWDHFANGGPWIADLFADRWGHTSAVSTAVNLLLGWLTRYNMKVDAAGIWLTQAAALVLILFRSPRSGLLAVGLVVCFMTARASEVWLNSWDLILPMTLLEAAAIGVLLSAPQLTVFRLVAAAAIASLSLITFAAGAAALAAAIVLLAWRSVRETIARFALVAWTAFTLAAIMLFLMTKGYVFRFGGVLTVDPSVPLRLAGFSLADPASVAVGIALILSALVLLAFLRPDDEVGRFWLYMLAFVAIFIVLLTFARPEPQSRYLVLLAVLPAFVAMSLVRLARGRKAAIAARLLVGAWLAFTANQSIQYGRLVVGWQTATEHLDEMVRRDPGSLTARDFVGIVATDDAGVTEALAIMKRLRVNIFAP